MHLYFLRKKKIKQHSKFFYIIQHQMDLKRSKNDQRINETIIIKVNDIKGVLFL